MRAGLNSESDSSTGSLPPAYRHLVNRFGDVGRLASIRSLLEWDRDTGLPGGSAATRAEQLGLLAKIRHARVTAPEVGHWLEEAETAAAELDAFQLANLGEMRREWRHEVASPPELATRIQAIVGRLHALWKAASDENEFELFRPDFEELLVLKRAIADAKSEALGLGPYEALIDEFDPGLTTGTIDAAFERLVNVLPAMAAEAMEKQSGWPPLTDLMTEVPLDRQERFCRELMAEIGFDFARGRVDRTRHAFCTSQSPEDVRIAIGYHVRRFKRAIMAGIHETGHGLYEQNLPAAWRFQPAGRACGASMHESQALLLEMFAARSRPFLQYLHARLQEQFPAPAFALDREGLRRCYRRVGSGLIRIDADELTYPLHVILRYRIEKALLAGEVQVSEIPAVWNELCGDLLGRSPRRLSEGCLQDVHWAIGFIGYFPTYTIGALSAAQFFEAACGQERSILKGLEHGNFGPLVNWLARNIHSMGRTLPSADIIRNATGAPLSVEPFISLEEEPAASIS